MADGRIGTHLQDIGSLTWSLKGSITPSGAKRVENSTGELKLEKKDAAATSAKKKAAPL